METETDMKTETDIETETETDKHGPGHVPRHGHGIWELFQII